MSEHQFFALRYVQKEVYYYGDQFSIIRLFREVNYSEAPGGIAFGANRSIIIVLSFCHPGTEVSTNSRGLQMARSMADRIVQNLQHATELYHRLILVVAPSGGGKTTALQDVAKRIDAPLINVNLELSKRMLDLTEKQRTLKLLRLMEEIVAEPASDVVILDNLELLFDVSLKQDPLRLLKGISRNRTVIASWNGSIDNRRLIYAAPEHPEYRNYMIQDFLVVDRNSSD